VLCYEHDVSLSVRLFVTLMDYDHTMHQKVEIGTLQDTSVSACERRPVYLVIENSIQKDQ